MLKKTRPKEPPKDTILHSWLSFLTLYFLIFTSFKSWLSNTSIQTQICLCVCGCASVQTSARLLDIDEEINKWRKLEKKQVEENSRFLFAAVAERLVGYVWFFLDLVQMLSDGWRGVTRDGISVKMRCDFTKMMFTGEEWNR